VEKREVFLYLEIQRRKTLDACPLPGNKSVYAQVVLHISINSGQVARRSPTGSFNKEK